MHCRGKTSHTVTVATQLSQKLLFALVGTTTALYSPQLMRIWDCERKQMIFRGHLGRIGRKICLLGK